MWESGLGRRRNENRMTVVTETSTNSTWSFGVGWPFSSSRSRQGNRVSVSVHKAIMTYRLLPGSPPNTMPREGISCEPSAVKLQGPLWYSFLHPILEISSPKLFYNYFLSTHFYVTLSYTESFLFSLILNSFLKLSLLNLRDLLFLLFRHLVP